MLTNTFTGFKVLSVLLCMGALIYSPALMAAGTIAASADTVVPLKVGEKLPKAQLKDVEAKLSTLSELTEGKASALILYRGGWCPYCNIHLKKLKEIEAALKGMGIQLIAISPDTPEKLGETRTEQELAYAVYSDFKMDVAKQLGVAYKMAPDKAERYAQGGIELVEQSLPVPSVFLVDEDGIIRFVHVDANYKKRLENDELLKAAKAIRDSK